jgi:hypothetical protein
MCHDRKREKKKKKKKKKKSFFFSSHQLLSLSFLEPRFFKMVRCASCLALACAAPLTAHTAHRNTLDDGAKSFFFFR